MKGDFSRLTFDPAKGYRRVLFQQGRVHLDADFNEQSAISQHQLERIAGDLLAPPFVAAHPAGHDGFRIFALSGFAFDGKETIVDAHVPHAGQRHQHFTIEAWINPADRRACEIITTMRRDARGRVCAGHALGLTAEGHLVFERVERIWEDEAFIELETLEEDVEFEFTIEELSLRRIVGSHVIEPGRYTHVAATLHDGHLELFVDGERSAHELVGRTVPGRDHHPTIGATRSGHHTIQAFSGIIDDLRIWRHARSRDELREGRYHVLRNDAAGLEYHFAATIGHTRKPAAHEPRQVPWTYWIHGGRCYVEGVLCSAPQTVRLDQQPDAPDVTMPAAERGSPAQLVYLDVWERYVGAEQDGALRESALGGVDTTGRVKSMTQVKTLTAGHADHLFVSRAARGRLRVTHDPAVPIDDNRLFRIEIAQSGVPVGTAATIPTASIAVAHIDKQQRGIRLVLKPEQALPEVGQCIEIVDDRHRAWPPVCVTRSDASTATVCVDTLPQDLADPHHLSIRPLASFIWSKDNGSLAYAVSHVESSTRTISLPDSGGDGIAAGDWIELSDERSASLETPAMLYRVEAVVTNDDQRTQIVVAGAIAPSSDGAIVRRWDAFPDATGPFGGTSALPTATTVRLACGVSVEFTAASYHRGEYWTFPVRYLTQRVEWPLEGGVPAFVVAQGTDHHHAPLAEIDFQESRPRVKDLRRSFTPLSHREISRDEHRPKRDHASAKAPAEPPRIERIVEPFSLLSPHAHAPSGYRTAGTVVVEPHAHEVWTSLEHRAPCSGAVQCAVIQDRVFCAFAAGELWEFARSRWERRADPPAGAAAAGFVALGNRLHLIGGQSQHGTLDTHHCYDPESDRWSPLRAMSIARSHLTTVVSNGRIFACGGLHRSGFGVQQPTALVEEYDPDIDEWFKRAALPTHLFAAAGVAIGERLYVIGGRHRRQEVQAELLEYHVRADRWITRAPMTLARARASAVAADRRIYVAGGEMEHGTCADVECYSVETGVWTPAPDLHQNAHSVGLVHQHAMLHAIGGAGDDADTNRIQTLRLASRLFVHEPLDFEKT